MRWREEVSHVPRAALKEQSRDHHLFGHIFTDIAAGVIDFEPLTNAEASCEHWLNVFLMSRFPVYAWLCHKTFLGWFYVVEHWRNADQRETQEGEQLFENILVFSCYESVMYEALRRMRW